MVWIIAGLKLAIPQSVIGAVIAEYVGSLKGLGYLILFAAANLDTTTVLACVAVLGTISVIISEIVKWLEARLLRWNAEFANRP
jgi:NitT/TauT family transport system permease protein